MQSPTYFNLDAPAPIVEYLRQKEWIKPQEHVEKITKAGEGNMNFVARIHTDLRTLIFKQSRPWVEKYPQIEAPVERIESEVGFYEAVKAHRALATGMPRLIAVDRGDKCALFEDLGEVEDYASMYDGTLAPVEEIKTLIRWISELHNTTFPKALKPALTNLAMRQLNHIHLYDFPLQPDNGLELDEITEGLQEEASRLQANEAYRAEIETLGEVYLSEGNMLLHGDFYPGSWVRTEKGPRVIDPEFCFFGPAEYDIGVCIAHLIMLNYPDDDIDEIMSVYEAPYTFDERLAGQFAGMEIMRRLIGVAQLPMTRTLEEKKALLARSEVLVTSV